MLEMIDGYDDIRKAYMEGIVAGIEAFQSQKVPRGVEEYINRLKKEPLRVTLKGE